MHGVCVAPALHSDVAKHITQREPRNNSGEITRQLDRGESFVVTRNGIPVVELARFYAAVVATGRNARGPRAVDLLIAATAVAANLPLYTRNINDFRGLEHLLAIVGV